MKPASHAIVIQLDQNVHNVILTDSVHVNQEFMVQNVINVDQDILGSQKLVADITGLYNRVVPPIPSES